MITQISQRPVHLSEYLLNTTCTLWEERVQRSWLAIDINNIKEKLKIFEPPPIDCIEQGKRNVSNTAHPCQTLMENIILGGGTQWVQFLTSIDPNDELQL